MIAIDALARALDRRSTSDWTVVERRVEAASIDEATNTRRRDDRTRTMLVVHVDTPDGRGTARLELDAFDGTIEDLVDRTQQVARAAIGPAWQSRPPAAPAKVAVYDKRLDKTDYLAVAQEALRALARPTGSTILARIEVARTDVTVRTQKGLHASWPESRLTLSALAIANDHALEVARVVRTRDELAGFDRALADAVGDLAQLSLAAPPVAGPCALILGADALLAGDHYGVWAPFATQADALRTRQGLDRYRLGMPVAPGADQLAEPLSITSDGALDYGVLSAPIDDDGIAVRRFPIVEGGVAVGLGFTPREAAFLKSQPNGGVRNLVVATGTWNDAIPDGVRTIEVHRLRNLAIDPYTGDASLEIALAIDHQGGASTAIGGGTIRLDLIAALAHAKRSTIAIQRGPYRGPRGVLIEHAELIA